MIITSKHRDWCDRCVNGFGQDLQFSPVVTQTVPHAVFLLTLSSGRALLSLLQMKTVPGLNSGLELISQKIEPFLRIKWAWTPAYLATGTPTEPGSITTSFNLFLNQENRLLENILIPALKFWL